MRVQSKTLFGVKESRIIVVRLAKSIMKVFLLLLLIGFVNVTSVYGQAPDCDICDQILEDGDPGDPQTLIEYAQCVEENCDGSIPVDTHIWLVMLGGIAIVYIYYRKRKLEENLEMI